MKSLILFPLALGMSVSAIGSELLISQYVEGSSNNKAIEIYNPTELPVTLDSYTLSFYFNGNEAAAANIGLSGTLAAKDTLVIADDNASSALLALADMTSSQSFFNGDDAIVLTDDTGVVLDSIGQVGVDPGSSWGSGSITTANDTLVRLATVVSGDTNIFDAYTTSEWTGLPQDDYTGLGSHNVDDSGDDGGDGGGDGGGDEGGDDDPLDGVCTNCPELDKVADASTFDASIYYAAVQAEIDAGASEAVIRQVLSDTISGQRVLTYTQVWTALTETDEDPDNNNNIVLIYSGNSIPKANNGSGADSSQPDYWNREHSWPKSHGFDSSGYEAYTDIQHLRPADITVNSSRGNLDFDDSDSPLAEAPENRVDGDSFEPRDAVKGDVARMMMYMDVRYEGAGSDSTPDLALVNEITSTGEPELGMLCTLLSWSDADPVDETEIRRQNAIYEYQGNRNPFVDHPEWVSLFYSQDTCGDTSEEEEEEVDPIPEATGTPAIMLTGVFDGPLSGGVPKGIELYVTRDIDDLSVCGVGSANNGGGSDGEEFTFPSDSASAGDFLYIASDTDGFMAFFGFAPDYVASSMSINGDDAIEVFCDDEVVDLYGDINTDGTGEAWDYLDSWAYRVTGGPSATFDIGQWNVAGTNALDGESDNTTAATPIPLATYIPPATELFFSEYIEGSGNNKAVEIVNLGLTEVDLSDYDVQIFFNGSVTAGQTIALSGTLAAGDVYVIAHSSADTEVQVEADLLSGSLAFNGDDTVLLRNDGTVVDSIGQIGVDPGSAWTSEGVSTQNATLVRKATITGGDENADDTFDPSLEWDGYASNTFDYLGSYLRDETETVDLGFCGENATLISTIQGSGSASPISGLEVAIEAIVTHVTPDLDGFWVQEEGADEDGDPLTSEGVFVAGSDLLDSVSEGDLVRLAGNISEEFGRTTISATSEVLVCGSGSVAPTLIALPMSDADEFEKYEGMLVTSSQNWVISNVYAYSDFGEIWVSTERLFTPTQLYAPGSTEGAALAQSNGLDLLIIDDNADGYAESWMLPVEGFSPSNTIRSGDLITAVTGVMDYGYSAYRIRPISTPTLVADNPRTEAPELSDGNLKVASFNVLNLFNGDGLGEGFPTERGATTYEEYQRQLTKIVKALVAIDADVVGLLELENDGFDSNSTLAQLVDALNTTMGANTYAYVDAGVEQLGTDAITSGIIYRPGSVTPVGSPEVLTSANSIVDDEGALFDDYGNRPSLAQLFTHNESGENFAVDVNHLKSKGSSCGEGDDSVEQGNCNLTRTRAATGLAAWLQETFGDTATIMLGDYNAYAQEDPVQVLTGEGYVNTVAQIFGSQAYSYSFDGLAGTLDYQFVNDTALAWLVDVTEWHINSDEPEIFDYNEEYKDETFLNELLYRASDHDPVIATYMLVSESGTLTGDWDGDGDVDNDDIRAFLLALFAREDIDMSFDLNGDNSISSSDIAVMRTLCTREDCATSDGDDTTTTSTLSLFSR
ncbi:ExeM/NucH family extracellular endonuclease [Alteromonas sp. C1M14]|uniref:ExeM/NucH family extracellular endonuclease n=1 Tax=Alteromonas sp. C1M14 TaxID=2841567 RepID=UPI001C091C3B|nr:ExeM/NucH family extracellular endonuclease [Alteromonas sp. C1M14]MBU2977602.1 ExeM/NucH family extracellular endonuclease [Alteromonas sp. C1M14]